MSNRFPNILLFFLLFLLCICYLTHNFRSEIIVSFFHTFTNFVTHHLYYCTTFLFKICFFDQFTWVVYRLFRPDSPSNNVTAKEVGDKIKVMKYSPSWSNEIGYIPHPNLIWGCSWMGGNWTTLTFSDPASLMAHVAAT